MSSRPNPLKPSPSNLSRTLTSTHTHYQHISPHRHLPHCIQAGSGYPTAQNTYIKHFSYRKLQICLLPFIAKTLKQVFFNQVSLFLSQNNKLDAKQSGFRSGHSTETALLSVTETLPIAKADSKSSVLILLDLSGPFWHCLSSDPLVHPLITGHHWDSTSLVWILSHWSVFQGGLGRGGIQSTSTGHWGSSGIVSWTPPLLHINYITGSDHTGTWLLLPFLCWWHTQPYLSFQPDDPTVAARISGCLADISAWMKEHHLQLNLAKTELLVFPATPTLQHDFTIQLGSSTITPSTFF